MRTIFAVVLLLAILLTVSSCNTMRGIGQDIEKGGQAIKKAAD